MQLDAFSTAADSKAYSPSSADRVRAAIYSTAASLAALTRAAYDDSLSLRAFDSFSLYMMSLSSSTDYLIWIQVQVSRSRTGTKPT